MVNKHYQKHEERFRKKAVKDNKISLKKKKIKCQKRSEISMKSS